MAKKASALHVVEKGKAFENLKCLSESECIWESGNWKISDATAQSLIGGMIYVHRGQNIPSHIGGNILSYRDTGKRKAFKFVAVEGAANVNASREGWANEKKVIWEGTNGRSIDVIIVEDDESAFPEGSERYSLHKARERDTKFSNKAKRDRLKKTGKLQCDVCSFDFFATFGQHGAGFIEAHHTVPVASLNGTVKTKASDLALVCSNCHRMLHRGEKLLSVAELQFFMQGVA